MATKTTASRGYGMTDEELATAEVAAIEAIAMADTYNGIAAENERAATETQIGQRLEAIINQQGQKDSHGVDPSARLREMAAAVNWAKNLLPRPEPRVARPKPVKIQGGPAFINQMWHQADLQVHATRRIIAETKVAEAEAADVLRLLAALQQDHEGKVQSELSLMEDAERRYGAARY